MSESDPLALNWASLINTAREREREGKDTEGKGSKDQYLSVYLYKHIQR